jgi:hypothetical protein
MKDRARVSSLDDSSPLDTTMEEVGGEPKLSDSEYNTEIKHIAFKSGKYKKYVIPRLILSIRSVSDSITTNVASSNPAQARCTRYNIMK